MQYRYLEVNEKYRIKDIYMDTFNDPEGYVDYYSYEYSENTDNYVCEDEGVIVAMANVHYRQIEYGGTDYNAAYIYGVATREQYRQLGIMTRIVTTLICDLKDRDIELIYLIPAINPKVYEKLGFRLIREETIYKIYNDNSKVDDSYEIYRTYKNTEQMKKHIENIFEEYKCRYVEYKVYPIMIYEPSLNIQAIDEEEQNIDTDINVRIEQIDTLEKIYSLDTIYNGFMYNDEV